MTNNKNLHKARNEKNNEFYTLLYDIENELVHYRQHFYDKTIYCNCDDPYESNFFKYFATNFNALNLKRLICTCYGESKMAGRQVKLDAFIEGGEDDKGGRKAYIIDINRDDPKGLCNLYEYEKLLKQPGVVKRLKGDGDFRSAECIEYLKQADIVVTNPPFSLFGEFVAQLVEYDKKFLVIGNENAITLKDVFHILVEDKIWTGYNHVKQFMIPDGTIQKFGNILWYTNLDIKKRHEPFYLCAKYDPLKYPKYDNYDAIDIPKVGNNCINQIPDDYYEPMGVPISFLDKLCPDQFEIVGISANGLVPDKMKIGEFKRYNEPLLNGQKKYQKLFIKRRQNQKE